MLHKLTIMVLTISAALAAFASKPSEARPWRGAVWSGRVLPGGGLRYGWGANGLGFYGYAVPYYADRGSDYYGSAFPSDFAPRNPSECGNGCPLYRFAVTGVR
jgi:hypothetical protein